MTFKELRGWHATNRKSMSPLNTVCVVCGRGKLTVHYHVCPPAGQFGHVDLCYRCYEMWKGLNADLLVARELMRD